MARTSYIRRDYDNVRFEIDQHAELTCKHVAPLEHEYHVFEQISLSLSWCQHGEATRNNYIVFRFT